MFPHGLEEAQGSRRNYDPSHILEVELIPLIYIFLRICHSYLQPQTFSDFDIPASSVVFDPELRRVLR